MSGLYVVLLALGIVGCAAAYRYGVRPRRRTNRMVRSPSWRQERGPHGNMEDVTAGASEHPVMFPDEAADATVESYPLDESPETVSNSGDDTASAETSTGADAGGVIVMHLIADNDHTFLGKDIRGAAEAVGMRLGAQGVFHHYGVGQMQSGESLFCLANMFEPGYFEMESLNSCQTKGLVLLMQLPLHIDSAVAFELLVSTAHRLVKRLGGHLLNERREPLTQDDIVRLRRIAAAA